MRSVRPGLQEMVFLLLCSGLLLWKLLLPGFVGMASNGDFGKVTGPLCMDGADHSADNFVFFQSQYLRGNQYCFQPPYLSSETALAWMASSIEQVVADRARFDIRWLGAIHSLLFVGFYFALLLVLRPLAAWARIAASIAGIWIFADAGTISYLNSFFTDTVAILGALSAAVLAPRLAASKKIERAALVAFGFAVLLFAGSKAHHALVAGVAVVFLGALAWRTSNAHWRGEIGMVALAALCVIAWMWISTPNSYTAQARFDLIFFWLLPNSKTPLQDLSELGLAAADARYAGLTTFSKVTPMNDPAWRKVFESRCTNARLLTFYLRHPTRALAKLKSDLYLEAPKRRVVYLSNYQRAAGKPAGARDQRLSSWSKLRTWIFRWRPGHVALWLGLALCFGPLTRKGYARPFSVSLAWTITACALLAIAEFAIVSLADAIETDRHLFLFHIFTDLTMFLALVWAASLRFSRSAHGDPI